MDITFLLSFERNVIHLDYVLLKRLNLKLSSRLNGKRNEIQNIVNSCDNRGATLSACLAL